MLSSRAAARRMACFNLPVQGFATVSRSLIIRIVLNRSLCTGSNMRAVMGSVQAFTGLTKLFNRTDWTLCSKEMKRLPPSHSVLRRLALRPQI